MTSWMHAISRLASTVILTFNANRDCPKFVKIFDHASLSRLLETVKMVRRWLFSYLPKSQGCLVQMSGKSFNSWITVQTKQCGITMKTMVQSCACLCRIFLQLVFTAFWRGKLNLARAGNGFFRRRAFDRINQNSEHGMWRANDMNVVAS